MVVGAIGLLEEIEWGTASAWASAIVASAALLLAVTEPRRRRRDERRGTEHARQRALRVARTEVDALQHLIDEVLPGTVAEYPRLAFESLAAILPQLPELPDSCAGALLSLNHRIAGYNAMAEMMDLGPGANSAAVQQREGRMKRRIDFLQYSVTEATRELDAALA